MNYFSVTKHDWLSVKDLCRPEAVLPHIKHISNHPCHVMRTLVITECFQVKETSYEVKELTGSLFAHPNPLVESGKGQY